MQVPILLGWVSGVCLLSISPTREWMETANVQTRIASWYVYVLDRQALLSIPSSSSPSAGCMLMTTLRLTSPTSSPRPLLQCQLNFFTEADQDELLHSTFFIKMCDDASWLYVEDHPYHPEWNWLLSLWGGYKIAPRFRGEVSKFRRSCVALESKPPGIMFFFFFHDLYARAKRSKTILIQDQVYGF